jgi:hypothetical protein
MKKLILIAMIIGCSLIADDLDTLEESYFSKASALQEDHDAKQKVISKKLATDSKRLAESYIKALKAMLKKETQKGDLDAAIKVKAKIVEMEAILNGEAVAPVVKPNPVENKAEPIVGKWKWHNGRIIDVLENGTLISKGKLSANKWTKVGENKYHLTNKEVWTVSEDGKTFTISINNRKYICKRITTDPIVGKWKAAKGSNKYLLHLFEGNACRFTVNGKVKLTGQWNVADGHVHIKWDGGKVSKYEIQEKKIVKEDGIVFTPLDPR